METENQRELLPFVRNFKALYPHKTVWCYSGYTWEQLTGTEPCAARCEVTDELLALLDVLVDGRFVEAQHDITLRFRGSSNQRLLDVPRSLAAGQPVWWEDEQVFATHTMLSYKKADMPPFPVLHVCFFYAYFRTFSNSASSASFTARIAAGSGLTACRS